MLKSYRRETAALMGTVTQPWTITKYLLQQEERKCIFFLSFFLSLAHTQLTHYNNNNNNNNAFIYNNISDPSVHRPLRSEIRPFLCYNGTSVFFPLFLSKAWTEQEEEDEEMVRAMCDSMIGDKQKKNYL